MIVGVAGTFLVSSLRATLIENVHESLEVTYRTIASRLVADPTATLGNLLSEIELAGERKVETFGQLIGSDGRVLDSTPAGVVRGPVVPRSVLARAAREGHWHSAMDIPGRHGSDLAVVIPLTGTRSGQYLVLVQTLGPAANTVARLQMLLLVLGPLALAFAAFGGWLLAGKALHPVDVMTRAARKIGGTRSNERIPLPHRDDELSRLANTLNEMLDRLGAALEAERRFSSDASHELRTPLGAMAAELDVALTTRPTTAEERRTLTSVREEVTRLGKIVDNLLVLSRMEAVGAVALTRADEDLFDLAVDVASRFRRVASRRKIDLRLEGEPATASVDAGLFSLALANLVDNALKYTPEGGRVTISVADGPVPSVAVSDTGPGIPRDELGHVFERFYRLDGARRRETGGAGLGLAIVGRVVEAHGATIDVSSEPGGGTTFRITLPTQTSRT